MTAQLDDFTRAYLTAALWSSTDNSDPETGGDPMDRNYGLDDFAPATLERAIADCKAFQEANTTDLATAYGLYDTSSDGDTPEAYAGRDFWLTRCGHGVGFRDRNLGDVGDRLTEAAKAFGQLDLEIGDDNLVYAI
jgi:hypothetical protein